MHSTILRFTFLYFAFFCLWSFVFTQTVFFPPVTIYAAFILLFLLFVMSIINIRNIGKIRIEVIVWIPFLVYTVLGYIVSFDGENVLYRIVCILLLLLGCRVSILCYIPKSFLFWSGIIAALGIFIQLLLPSLYNSYILPLFVTNQDRIEIWMRDGYGLSGFYYQLSHAAMNLILAEAVILYLIKDNYKGSQRQRLLFYFSFLAIFLALLLTGKRSFAVMAIIIPLIVYVSRKKQLIVLMSCIIMGAGLAYMALSYFIDNISIFSDDIFLHRLAETVEEIQSGQDISSGRDDLFKSAIRLYEANPIFGVGVGQYVHVSRQYSDVHNAYLQVLCEQGVVGLVLFVCPLIICLINTIRSLRVKNVKRNIQYLELSLFIQIYFIMYSFTGNTMVNYEVFFIYYLAISLLTSIKADYSKSCRIQTMKL